MSNYIVLCQVASSYCQKRSSGHSKIILLCLTESTSTAMTIDCPTELHCQDNHIVWPSVLCQDNIFVLPKEMTSVKTILDCLAEWFLPRQRIVLPKFLMVDKTIWLSYCRINGFVRHLNCLSLLMYCLALARLSFLLVFVLSLHCLTSTKLCLYIWLSFFISKCSSLCKSKHL